MAATEIRRPSRFADPAAAAERLPVPFFLVLSAPGTSGAERRLEAADQLSLLLVGQPSAGTAVRTHGAGA